jgi:UDP-N-acetylglucosamine 2-epimerase (non-hydrolysing)
MKFIIVTGARPNFMKIAPLCEEFDKEGIGYDIFNSGQHYDEELNGAFQKQFNLKNIFDFKISCDNKIKDIQEIICSFKGFLQPRFAYTAVIVVGDVDTTFACALTAKRYGFPLIHIEAGLRSFDAAMPEERNRIAVDHLSNILFASCHNAEHNLFEEGIEENVYMVGNIMIDTLLKFLPSIKPKRDTKHIVVTLHRPDNVDSGKLYFICEQLRILSNFYEIVFPVHPRTMKKLKEFNILYPLSKCILVKPLGYLEFLSEVINAEAVITDSGGIQEETTYLGIPCFTVRPSTERSITITEGSNRLVKIEELADQLLSLEKKTYQIPKLWDGHTAERITDILKKEFNV